MWDAEKLRSFDRSVRESLSLTEIAAKPDLGFNFRSDRVVDIVKQHTLHC